MAEGLFVLVLIFAALANLKYLNCLKGPHYLKVPFWYLGLFLVAIIFVYLWAAALAQNKCCVVGSKLVANIYW